MNNISEELVKQIGTLDGYEPQMIGRITPRQVHAYPGHATLRQKMLSIMTDPKALQYEIDHYSPTIWLATAVYLDPKDGNHRWAEHVRFDDGHEEPSTYNAGGKLVIAKSGFAKPVRDGMYQGKPYYVLYDIRENGGFPRDTTEDKEEAQRLAQEAGFDPRIVSSVDFNFMPDYDKKKWRLVTCYTDFGSTEKWSTSSIEKSREELDENREVYGLVPICTDYSEYTPLSKLLDRRETSDGCLFTNGSDQKQFADVSAFNERMNMRFLLVEDNPSFAEAAMRYLSSINIQVDHARDYMEAERLLQSNQYNGAVIDCFFPEDTGSGSRKLGIEVSAKIKKENRFSELHEKWYRNITMAMNESEANQPLGRLVAERCEELGLPFVMATSHNHHNGLVQGSFYANGVFASLKELAGVIDGQTSDHDTHDEKDIAYKQGNPKNTPEFWEKAYDTLFPKIREKISAKIGVE